MLASSSTSIPLLNLQAQYASIRSEIREAVDRVMDSQHFILGPTVEAFEKQVAAYCGAAHAVGCASGSDALLLALKAAGVTPGDEVITVPFTFFATAGAIIHAGATPVFVDVDAATFNLDPDLLEDAVQAHPKARAVIPVHLFGAAAEMDAINDIAGRAHLTVIEDAAQAIGAEYRNKRAGSLSPYGCFSFFPTKNLGGFGDGGCITTDDPAIADRLRMLRLHGSRERYIYEEVGYNSRLDALQAAILSVKLRHLDQWIAGRQHNAARYSELFAQAKAPVVLPKTAPYQTRHVYNQYSILCPKRDQLRSALAEQGIGSEVYYPVPLHLQKCFSYLEYQSGDFPVSERLAREILSLPIYAELPAVDLERVVLGIAAFYAA